MSPEDRLDDMVSRRLILRQSVWAGLVALAEAVQDRTGTIVSPMDVAVIALEAGLSEVKRTACRPAQRKRVNQIRAGQPPDGRSVGEHLDELANHVPLKRSRFQCTCAHIGVSKKHEPGCRGAYLGGTCPKRDDPMGPCVYRSGEIQGVYGPCVYCNEAHPALVFVPPSKIAQAKAGGCTCGVAQGIRRDHEAECKGFYLQPDSRPNRSKRQNRKRRKKAKGK